MDYNFVKIALPHVTKVWVLNGEWYIHFVPDAVEVGLSDETISQDSAKPSKKK
jgi:hypothetical protein